MIPPSLRSPDQPASTERTVSLNGLIFRAVVGLVVLVATMAAIARWVAPAGGRRSSGVPVLAATTLADGSVVEVVAITVGERHHLTLPRRANEFWQRWLGRTTTETLKISARRGNHPCVQIWLARRRPGSNRMVVFEEFRRGRINTPDGTLLNQDCRTFAHGVYQTNHVDGPPPYKVPLSLHADDIVLTALEYPLFEASPHPIRLELFGNANRLLGTIDIPVPPGLLPTRATWVAPAFPQVAVDGPFTATLVDVRARPQPGRGLRVNPQVEFRRGADLLHFRYEKYGALIDPLGNVSHLSDCDLSLDDSAWRMPIEVWLGYAEPLRPGVVWTTPLLELPPLNSAVEMPHHGTIDSGRVQVRFDRFCRGKAPPQLLPPRAMERHNRIKKMTVAGTGTTWSTDSVPGGDALLVNGDVPFVIVEFTGLAENEKPFVAAVRDDLGRKVKFEAEVLTGTLLLFPQPLADAKSLRFTFGIEARARFEFRFAPPTPSAASAH
jgi:hypothetical protein